MQQNELSHFLLIENRYPGSWGRGKTHEEAIRAGGIRSGSEVFIAHATDDAHVDQLGRIYATELKWIAKATVSKKQTLYRQKPLEGNPFEE